MTLYRPFEHPQRRARRCGRAVASAAGDSLTSHPGTVLQGVIGACDADTGACAAAGDRRLPGERSACPGIRVWPGLPARPAGSPAGGPAAPRTRRRVRRGHRRAGIGRGQGARLRPRRARPAGPGAGRPAPQGRRGRPGAGPQGHHRRTGDGGPGPRCDRPAGRGARRAGAAERPPPERPARPPSWAYRTSGSTRVTGTPVVSAPMPPGTRRSQPPPLAVGKVLLRGGALVTTTPRRRAGLSQASYPSTATTWTAVGRRHRGARERPDDDGAACALCASDSGAASTSVLALDIGSSSVRARTMTGPRTGRRRAAAHELRPGGWRTPTSCLPTCARLRRSAGGEEASSGVPARTRCCRSAPRASRSAPAHVARRAFAPQEAALARRSIRGVHTGVSFWSAKLAWLAAEERSGSVLTAVRRFADWLFEQETGEAARASPWRPAPGSGPTGDGTRSSGGARPRRAAYPRSAAMRRTAATPPLGDGACSNLGSRCDAARGAEHRHVRRAQSDHEGPASLLRGLFRYRVDASQA